MTMNVPVNDAIVAGLSSFIDANRSPSHSELTTLISSCGLARGNPDGETIGKLKRVRRCSIGR